MNKSNKPTYETVTAQAKAYRLVRSQIHEVLEKYQLTPTHWSILGMIYEARRSSGIRSSDIAVEMQVKAPLVTLITRELITRKYVSTKTPRSDGRARLLTITSEGARFIRQIELDLQKSFSRLLNGVTDAELSTYNTVLQRMIQNAL